MNIGEATTTKAGLIIHNFMYLYSIDTNECVPVSPCHANASCNNTEGSYICTCDSGYSGDGYTCYGKTFMHNINIRQATTYKSIVNYV